jgi:hypothetical protein
MVDRRYIINNPFGRVGGMKAAALTVWRRPKNSSNVLIPDAGHSVQGFVPDSESCG